MITGFIYGILMSYLTWKGVKAFRCLGGVLPMCRIDIAARKKRPLATSSSQYSTERCLYTPVSRPYLRLNGFMEFTLAWLN